MTSFETANAPVRPVGAGGEVIIEPAEGPDDPRASEASRALMHFVAERTGGSRLLRRCDFSPADIKKYLTNIMILEIVYGDDGQVSDGIVRLMGSALAHFYGEYTGRSVLEHPSQSGKRSIFAVQTAIDCQGIVLGSALQASPEQAFFKLKTCVVPIADGQGQVTQALIHFQLYNSNGEPFNVAK